MGVGVRHRRPEVAARTPIAETTIDPDEIARHHNRKRKAAESSGRKDAKTLYFSLKSSIMKNIKEEL